MAKASIRVHSSDNTQESAERPDVISLLIESLGACGQTDKAACIDMRFDASQFSKVKQGQARLPLDAAWELDDRFWDDFTMRVRRARGLCEQSKAELRAARIAELLRLLLEVA